MINLRQGFASKRVSISVVALYALLMQGFLAAAAQTGAFDSFGELTCSSSSSTGPDGGDGHHQQCLCCILACAASGCAYLAASCGLAAFPARTAATIVWTVSPGDFGHPSQRFHFAARGPPVEV